MNQFVKDKIQQPIERMLNAPGSNKETSWYEIRTQIATARKQYGFFNDVHEALLPFYKKYMMASPIFFQNKEEGRKARSFMFSHLEEEYTYFFSQLSDINLVECAKNWSKYPQIEKHLDLEFSRLLMILFTKGVAPNLEQAQKELYSRFEKREEYGNYKELELYCILIAFILVSQRKDISEEAKKVYYTQICDNWSFLKYMYSFMLKHIIGMKSMNFANVISSLVKSKTYYCYMHIAHKTIEYNMNGLYKDGDMDYYAHRPVKAIIDEKLSDMKDIIKKNYRNESLTPLCNILFHKKFDEVLQQSCPLTYEEIELKLRSIVGEIATKDKNYNNLVEKLVRIISTSVSIEEIKKAFEGYPVDFALKTFDAINGLLIGNGAWNKNAADIRNSILNNNKTTPTTINNTFMPGSNTFNAGSTMQGEVHNK